MQYFLVVLDKNVWTIRHINDVGSLHLLEPFDLIWLTFLKDFVVVRCTSEKSQLG